MSTQILGTRLGRAAGAIAVAAAMAVLCGCPCSYVLVPSLLGMAEEEVAAVLRDAGLQSGEVTDGLSNTIPAGRVMSQDPPGGARVASCSVVNVVISSGSDCTHSPNAPIPDLRPISVEDATKLGAHVRGMRTVAAGGEPRPVAWAMVNTGCEGRTLAMQYAIASASLPLSDTAPVMHEEDITAEHIADLADHPGIDVATINLTGPLIAEQTWVQPDGTPVSGDPLFIYWPYHHAVVLNVDGELMVLDLSVQDEPMTIEAWVRSFVTEDVVCVRMSDTRFQRLWGYWLDVMGYSGTAPRPPCLCGCTITPIFRFRWDQDPLVDALRWTPSDLETQLDAFGGVLESEYGLIVDEGQLPWFTSDYVCQDEAYLCGRVPLPYCDQRVGSEGSCSVSLCLSTDMKKPYNIAVSKQMMSDKDVRKCGNLAFGL